MLEKPSRARTLGEAAKRVVEANRGATDRYLNALEKYL
jgi:3-deoxy-D-manno-octulosonic-acid transferase